MHSDAIHKKAFARVGLLGNPSDGYHGKTLSLSVANFFATVSSTACSTNVSLTSSACHTVLDLPRAIRPASIAPLRQAHVRRAGEYSAS